jgi:predicted regulator of amino acid metabolism with ACT domain
MTARCAPAHKRVVNTLRRRGITVDEDLKDASGTTTTVIAKTPLVLP